LAEIAARESRGAEVLERFGLDYCCGGRQTLVEACRASGVDPRRVVGELARLAAPSAQDSFDLTSADLDRLADHIVDRHHAFVRAAIPAITAQLDTLVDRHGERHPELARIRELFADLGSEMHLHMFKEEHVLFPYIRALARAAKGMGHIPANIFGTVQNPIRMMELEHQAAGDETAAIRQLADDYTAPPDGCATYAACFADLAAFEADLHRHVHLENNVLFPRAVELELRLQRQPVQSLEPDR
jgi:regulator of cell morphogenesis and NO signaling